tara:strand:+ start:442 stop:876 length:435 start_codon:yes stop_codon:yes gene_type:complete
MLDINVEMQTFGSAIINLLELGVPQKDLREELEIYMTKYQEFNLPGPGDLPHHADPQTQPDEVEFNPISMEDEIREYLMDSQNLGDLLALYTGKWSATEVMCKYLWSYYCGVSDETTDFYQKKLLESLRETFEKEIEGSINDTL